MQEDTHTQKKLLKWKKSPIWWGNSQVWSVVSVSVCTIRLSTSLMLLVLCLFGRCLSGFVPSSEHQLHKHSHTHTHARTAPFWLICFFVLMLGTDYVRVKIRRCFGVLYEFSIRRFSSGFNVLFCFSSACERRGGRLSPFTSVIPVSFSSSLAPADLCRPVGLYIWLLSFWERQ